MEAGFLEMGSETIESHREFLRLANLALQLQIVVVADAEVEVVEVVVVAVAQAVATEMNKLARSSDTSELVEGVELTILG